MRPAENIKRSIKNARIAINPEVKKAALKELINELEKSKITGLVVAGPNVWRTIMKSNITKLSTAAVIIVAAALSVSLWDKAIPAAYAIEQTIEAISNTLTVHLYGRDWNDNQVEMWVKANEDTKEVEYFYVDKIDERKLIVATPELTYYYDRQSNTVRKVKGQDIHSYMRMDNVFEQVNQIAEDLGGTIVDYRKFDEERGQEVIVLEVISEIMSFEALIDPETYLPISIGVTKRANVDISREILRYVDEIYYDDPVPEGIFEFEIPKGAKVLDVDVVSPQIDYSDAQDLDVVNGLRSYSEVISYATKIDEEAASRSGSKWVNTKLYFVDENFEVLSGGVGILRNNSDKTLTGEVYLWNTDSRDDVLYDELGKRQKIRLSQRKKTSPGKFSFYWTLDRPLEPWQSRSYFCCGHTKSQLAQHQESQYYMLRMQNFPGARTIESFILVLPRSVEINRSSVEHTSHETVGEFDVYTWQKDVPYKTNHVVEAVLRPKTKSPTK
jgi:outer membrane lipoprotein-sorting protein